LGAWWRRQAAEPDDQALRRRMVERQIMGRGVTDPRVLDALRQVPRHQFVPEVECAVAYADRPVPIGAGQTASQPYMVAVMTELLATRPDHVVLDVGTGSGYQAAVLSRLVRQVYSIEIIPELAERARKALERAGCRNVEVVIGDGSLGLPEHAPFSGILVAAAPERVPEALVEQLAPGGRLVIPVGPGVDQQLRVLRRDPDGVCSETLFEVRFVPMTGAAADSSP
jgi:protein-L-isoaspartate(D-aspartate) O-methyltransferase